MIEKQTSQERAVKCICESLMKWFIGKETNCKRILGQFASQITTFNELVYSNAMWNMLLFYQLQQRLKLKREGYMSAITKVHGREILDSRGNPTVEAEVTLVTGVIGRASVPSGASVGTREALELRDLNSQRYLGKGVLKAVAHINENIQAALLDRNVNEQTKLDQLLIDLDKTPNKAKLGANATLAVSMAIAKAAAQDSELTLYEYFAELSDEKAMLMPVPLMNIINGGAHADNLLSIQEFMIVPIGAPTFSEALRCGAEVFHALKKLLAENHLSTAVGDEGGFAPNLPSHRDAIDFILSAIEKAGYKAGRDVCLALDVAASELYGKGQYYLPAEGKQFTSEEFCDYLVSLVNDYPIISIEDGMAEDDWQGWIHLTSRLGNRIQLVGDDIFVTNTEIFKKGISLKIANAILIKPNQIGTITETLAAIKMAKEADYGTIISHRSGETEDTTIADLAVGSALGQIKTGSLSRTDRLAKYNQLLRIEEKLGSNAIYAGKRLLGKLIK